MNYRKYVWGIPACIISVMSFISSGAIASEQRLDGSNSMACSLVDVVACAGDKSACIKGTTRGFDLPELFIYESEGKHLRATYESGHKAVSPVKNLEVNGEHLIMQGVENSRAWSFAIDTKTGNMSGSGVGKEVNFLIFGICTTL